LKEVSIAYFECAVLNKKIDIYRQLDSIYTRLLKQYEKRMSLNDAKKLEYLNIKSKRNELAVSLSSFNNLYDVAYKKLKVFVNTSKDFLLTHELEAYPFQTFKNDSLQIISYLQLQDEYSAAQVAVAKNTVLPDFTLNYFIGSNQYQNAEYYHGFEVGVALPLFYKSYSNSVKSAKLASEAQHHLMGDIILKTKGRIEELKTMLAQNQELIEQYYEVEIPLANEIKRTALSAYEVREIDFFHLTNSLEAALKIESGLYDIVFNYNKNYIELLYFTN
jgi:cobalt-zinc-cadmium resistance protein CzcA